MTEESADDPDQVPDIKSLLNVLLDSIDIGVMAIDRTGKISAWNRYLEEYTGLALEKALGHDLLDLFPDLHKEGWDLWLDMTLKGKPVGSFPGEGERPLTMRGIKRKGSAEVFQNITITCIRGADRNVAHAVVLVQDVSELGVLKQRLERYTGPVPMLGKTSLANYTLEEGRSYLIKEESPTKAYDIFVEAVRFGLEGLVVTRQNPHRLRESLGLEDTSFIWLTKHRVDGEICVTPQNLVKLSSMLTLFMEKIENSIILMDGLEYLMVQTSFDSMLKFVQSTVQKVGIEGSRLVIPLDPHTMSPLDLRLLEKELDLF